MTNRIIHRITRIILAVFLIGVARAATVSAADDQALASCAIAAEYDRQADAFEAGAERYRAWAAAAGMATNDQSMSEWAFARQAERLAAAAEQSRDRAAEVRRSATSKTASRGHCTAPTCS
jgi:hypothetical protein